MEFKSFRSESPRERSGESDGKNGQLASRDVVGMLELMGDIARVQHDARRWRMELLSALTHMLRAAAAAACIAKLGPDGKSLELESACDIGFTVQPQYALLFSKFNQGAFGDMLVRGAELAANGGESTVSALRKDLVEDDAWHSSDALCRYRRDAQIDDCLLSLHWPGAVEGGGEPRVIALLAFRRWGAAGFSGRELQLLDTLHSGIGWMYRGEETRRSNRAAVLTPRLRETLDYILAGDTARKAATKMEISIHTVHDYVKALYVHFGVSSRGELMARWIQDKVSSEEDNHMKTCAGG